MSHLAWLSELLARFEDEHILVRRGSAEALAPAHLLELDPEDWGRAAAVAARFDCRWAGGWGEECCEALRVSAVIEKGGDHVVLRTEVPKSTPVLPSHTPHFRGADRLERHLQDMVGLSFLDHPDPRRWTRHGAWPEGHFPLRAEFSPVGGPPAPAADGYQFIQAQGPGVYEIPVGPVHAGIIEPGHFRFQAVGEAVLNLEERLGYVHKGVEKVAEGRDPEALARLAGRVSGDTTVGHTWAACMALERAVRLAIPRRAAVLRAIMAERERIANHLGDIGAICNDVGFAFAFYQFARLRELWQRDSLRHLGHRLMMDRVVPGGVATDLDLNAAATLRSAGATLRKELKELLPLLNDYPSLEDRLVSTGVLSKELARRLGTLGYVARASGLDYDLRRDYPYAPYEVLTVNVPIFSQGDVAARMNVRAGEILTSLDLLDQLLRDLPEGAVRTAWKHPGTECEGLGLVEGWRGEILTYVRLDAQGRVRRFFPRDPSWFNWPALEELIQGNIVPDFPVCNKSVNGSYSGHDL